MTSKALFLSCVCLTTFAFAKSPVDLFKQISTNKKTLQQTQADTKHMSRAMRKIAAKIEKINKELLEYDKKLDKLDKYLTIQQTKYQNAMDDIDRINSTINAIDKDINNKKREFAKKISRSLGAVVAQNNSTEKTEESVLLQEIYQKYKNYNQQELLKLSKNIEQKRQLKRALIAKRDKISKGISNIQTQKNEYLKEKKKKQALLEKLRKEEQIYAQKLKNNFKRQAIIRLTLTKLNIVAADAAKESARKERELKKRIRELRSLRIASQKERKEAIKSGKKVDYKVVTINRVKQYGSSYSKANITSYRGMKTFAPLRRAVVLKSFGTFIDPIYKIKSFNDYITLSSKAGDKRVYNILNGKVTYIANKSMLGKMVIVEHSNHLHTIYADLDKISPFLKVGLPIKKGSVIGKIKRKLIFEATKNGKFINPKQLIDFSM